jgi:aldehyde:ferredoxin oxidoreductase
MLYNINSNNKGGCKVMDGYAGKIAIVDLTDKTVEYQDLNEEYARNFLGGAALGARYMYDLMPAHTPVFAPDSIIGFVSGPLNGTRSLLGGRFNVVSKSPVYDGFNDASCGGKFGPTLKKAGFDAIFVKGISETPVYLYAHDGQVEIKDATAYWGKTTSQTDEGIKEELADSKLSTALIGPGGEHLSHMAGIIGDKFRAAARGGSGAVAGSKMLKGVVASPGSTQIEVNDPKTILEVNREWQEHAKGRGEVPNTKFKAYGTSADYDAKIQLADCGIKNWGGLPEMLDEDQVDSLCGRNMDPIYRYGNSLGCDTCPVNCGALYHIKSEKYGDVYTCRPQYESTGAFGAMLLCGDADLMNYSNFMANEYGYDTLSLGGTIAWLMECYEHGLFTQDELDGIDLKWGDIDAVVAITKKICDFEGIGIPLNLASQGAADHFGKGHEYLCTASGIEPAMHGSRFNPALARTYQYDPTPGRHVKGGRGVPFGHQPLDVKYNFEGTGEADRDGIKDWEVMADTGFCLHGGFLHAPGAMFRYINAITGFGYSMDDFNDLALRSFTIRSAFNLREGKRRKDYTISGRNVGKPPLEGGPLEGLTVDNEKLADNFFAAMDWDVETAVPSKRVLEKLGGLECLIKDLYPNG